MKYLTHTILIAMIVVAAIFNSYFVNDVAANPDPLFETGQQVGTLLRSDVIEASGLASSRRNTGVLYTHDDSGGDNVFFAINTEGTLLGTYTLATGSMSDAEDIAVGPGPTPDVNYVFVGDIGDNGNSRPYITVKRVAEPEISSDQGHESVTLSGVDLIKLQYPSGGDAPSHKDTETLMIDTNGDIYIVTKRMSPNKVYRAAYPQSTSEINVMELVATLPTGTGMAWITGGDISYNGRWIITTNDQATDYACIWCRSPDTDLWDAFEEDRTIVNIENEPQGEGICYDPQGCGFYTVSEAHHSSEPIWYYARNNILEVSNPYPENGSVDNILTPLLNITVSDDDGNEMDITWRSNSSGTWATFGSNISITDGVYCMTNNNFSNYDTTYYWSVNVTNGYHWKNRTYHFSTRESDAPSPPSSFSAAANGRFQIDLSWSDDNEADSTLLEWSSNPDSWIRGEGTELYNGSAESTSHSGLSPGTTRYYQAWSWNVSDGVWSSSYSSASATTDSNTAPNLGTPNPTNESGSQELTLTWNITITDDDGDSFDWTIECSNGQSSNGNDASNGTKQLSISDLSYNTQYTIYVNVTDSFDIVNDWFAFTTKDASENESPIFSSIFLSNESTDVLISSSQLSITIEDPEGDAFSWTIITSPDIGSNSGTNENNGSKTCSISGLSYSTTYTWIISSKDVGSESWNNKSYWFITEAYDDGGSSGSSPPSGDGGYDGRGTTIETNSQPEIPNIPYGPLFIESGIEYVYSSSTNDTDGDQIRYKFDWGDGNYSDWSDFVASNISVLMSHFWNSLSSFEVRVIAQDENGENSSWSSSLNVTVSQVSDNMILLPPTLCPPDGSTLNSSNLVISITFHDNVTIVNATFNNLIITFIRVNDSYFIDISQFNLTDGTYTLSVLARDDNNNTLLSNVSYTVQSETLQGAVDKIAQSMKIRWDAVLLICLIIAAFFGMIMLRKFKRER